MQLHRQKVGNVTYESSLMLLRLPVLLVFRLAPYRTTSRNRADDVHQGRRRPTFCYGGGRGNGEREGGKGPIGASTL
jgi:uncharacterized protein (UPF0548 family)